METFSLCLGTDLWQPSLTLTQDKGLGSDAPIQGSEGFGHAAQLQVGKDTTLLTKAVSTSQLTSTPEQSLQGALAPFGCCSVLGVWECKFSSSTTHKMCYPTQRNWRKLQRMLDLRQRNASLLKYFLLTYMLLNMCMYIIYLCIDISGIYIYMYN